MQTMLDHLVQSARLRGQSILPKKSLQLSGKFQENMSGRSQETTHFLPSLNVCQLDQTLQIVRKNKYLKDSIMKLVIVRDLIVIHRLGLLFPSWSSKRQTRPSLIYFLLD